MKLVKISLAAIVFLATFTFATNNPADESAVKKAITEFYTGIDSRNSSAVEKSLYSEATVVTFNMISNKTNKMTADDLISKVKNGSLGGWKREVNVEDVQFNEKTAIAKVEISDSKLKQTSFVTLVNDEGTWKIVSDVATVSPKSLVQK